jgi:hypothetical protein
MAAHFLRHAHALPTEQGLLLGLVDVGTAFWLVLYVLAIVAGFRGRTYAIPCLAICANFSWELIAAVWRIAPERLWHYGDILWLCLDAVVVYTLLRYGRARQAIAELQRWFYWMVLGTFLLALVVQYSLESALEDRWGFLDAYIISVMMSALFFFLYFSRRAIDNLTYAIAWCKCLGNGLTSAGFVFLYHEFYSGQAQLPLLHVLCLVNVGLDVGYVALIAKARGVAGSGPAPVPGVLA